METTLGRRFVRSAQVAPRLACQSFAVTTTELRQGTGDKLADIHSYAIDLEASGTPEEVQVGHNLMLILRGKNK
jgi:hypothetical protein